MELEPARLGLLSCFLGTSKPSGSSARGARCRSASSRPIAEARRCTGATVLASEHSLNEHDGFSSELVCCHERAGHWVTSAGSVQAGRAAHTNASSGPGAERFRLFLPTFSQKNAPKAQKPRPGLVTLCFCQKKSRHLSQHLVNTCFPVSTLDSLTPIFPSQ